jgi:hypothetical protein
MAPLSYLLYYVMIQCYDSNVMIPSTMVPSQARARKLRLSSVSGSPMLTPLPSYYDHYSKTNQTIQTIQFIK